MNYSVVVDQSDYSISIIAYNNKQLLHAPELNSVNYYYPRRGQYSTRPKAEWNFHTKGSNKHAVQ